MKNLENKKGFTLVELLIVIAVLGVLAGVGVNSMSGISKSFKQKADEETAKMLVRGIEVKLLANEISSDDMDADSDLTGYLTENPTPQTGGTAFSAKMLVENSNDLKVEISTDGSFTSTTIDIADKAVE